MIFNALYKQNSALDTNKTSVEIMGQELIKLYIRDISVA